MPQSRHARLILALSLALAVMSVTAPPPPRPVTPSVVGDKSTVAGGDDAAETAETAETADSVDAADAADSVDAAETADAADAAGTAETAVGGEQVAVPPTARSVAAVLQIPYRIELRSSDPAVADALQVIPAVLEDPRGWQQAAIDFVPDPDAPFVIVVAEGADAQALCRPYDVGGRFSCQNGPLVVFNAIRWREGVDHWPDDPRTCEALGPGAASTQQSPGPCLASYRTMLVNHEIGHLLGMHHMRCATPGAPAPVMEQQSGTLRGCQANAWPSAIELRLAATHQFQVAPPPLDVTFPP